MTPATFSELNVMELDAVRDLLADALELPRSTLVRDLAIEAATVIRLSRLGDAMSTARRAAEYAARAEIADALEAAFAPQPQAS